MNILLITCKYDSKAPSGENIVYEREKKLLIDLGYNVSEYTHDNSTLNRSLIGKFRAVCNVLWSFKSNKEIKTLLSEKHFDIIHIHNTFPTISLSIIKPIIDSKIKTFMTLHNYRLVCVKGILLRDQKICTRCLKRNNPISGVFFKCYRKSILASFLVYLSIQLSKNINFYDSGITFIALTKFQNSLLREVKQFSKSNILTKPHFIDNNYKFQAERKNQFVFVGRFSDEKGIRELVREWKNAKIDSYKILFIGEGELSLYLKTESERNPSIKILPAQDNKTILKILAESKYLIFSSLCYETFGLSQIESFSVGTPVISTNIGSNSEIVKEKNNGFMYDPYVIGNGSDTFKKAVMSDTEYDKLVENSFYSYKKFYSKDVNGRLLTELYDK